MKKHLGITAEVLFGAENETRTISFNALIIKYL